MVINKQKKILDTMELMVAQPFPLWDLPLELRQHVFSFLPANSLRLFSRVNKSAALETISLRFLPLLLHYVAHAKPLANNQSDKSTLAAEKILQVYPALLFAKDFTKDPAGNKIYGSAWRIAWGAGDIWMLKMMMEIIPKIKNGIEMAKIQYAEQFPGGSRLDERNKKQIAQIEKDVNAITDAISVDPCLGAFGHNHETLVALDKLKEHLAPKQDEVISTGKHSPPEILKIIHDVYDQYSSVWKGTQLALYAVEVIGSAEQVATGVDAQRYKKGLCHYEGEQIAPDRTDSYFYPTGEMFVGFEPSYHYRDYYGRSVRLVALAATEHSQVGGSGALINYVQEKESGLDELKQQLENFDLKNFESMKLSK